VFARQRQRHVSGLWLQRLTAIGWMAYASLIELSPDYPRTIGTWRLPTALTGNGRWTVFCILGPPVVLALCAAQERRPRSHPALLAEVLLAIAALGAIASALLSLAPVQSTTEYAVRYVACWLLFRTLLNLKSDTPDRLLPTLLAGIGLTEALAALGQGLIATVPAWWPPSRPLPVHNGGAGSGWWLLRVEGLTAYHTILGAQLAILLPFVVLVSRRAGRGTVLPVGLILVALLLQQRAGELVRLPGRALGSRTAGLRRQVATGPALFGYCPALPRLCWRRRRTTGSPGRATGPLRPWAGNNRQPQ